MPDVAKFDGTDLAAKGAFLDEISARAADAERAISASGLETPTWNSAEHHHQGSCLA